MNVKLKLSTWRYLVQGDRVTLGTVMRFFLGTVPGMLITLTLLCLILYYPAPVLVHGIGFQWLVLTFYGEVAALVGMAIGDKLAKRYRRRSMGRWSMLPIYLAFITTGGLLGFGLGMVVSGIIECQIYRDSAFHETSEMPRVSTKLVRYTPQHVAAEEIVRRTQTSEFTPGATLAIGSANGVDYITPLIPQGIWNTLLEENHGFMYFDDGGTDDHAQRVRGIATQVFTAGEGMEIFDDIHRRLIHEIGFFKSYPEIYYAPIEVDGVIQEVVGVVPYLSYRFWWGLFIPYWGGVAIFHADGRLENLTPEEAVRDHRLLQTYRLFPETLARRYVQAQRFDRGLISGWIRRPGKIEIPDLPGEGQMPFFLPMENGGYQYITMVEPDGEAFSLMRIYMVDARTGRRTYYRFDRPGRNGNLLGPAKALSYTKTIRGYNWYEEAGGSRSGSYRIVEPRPVTPARRGGVLYWMYSITPADFTRVVATVFINSETNEVVGPIEDRVRVYAWLNGEDIEIGTSAARAPVAQPDLDGFCSKLRTTCSEINILCGGHTR